MNTTKIWLGSLEAYNNGELKGEWLELPMDEEKLREVYNQYTNDGQNDYFIADHESEVLDIGEYSDPFELNEQAEEIEDLEDYEIKKLNFLIECQGYDFDDAIEKIEDCDLYEDMSFKDLAYEFVEEGLFGEIPEHLANYIDYDAIARDLEMDYTEHNGDIFRCD